MITTIRRPVIKQCPFKDETDAGELVITFHGEAPELHKLGAEIDKLAYSSVSHEDFTAAVAAIVAGAHVQTTWHTGPWSVEVSESA